MAPSVNATQSFRDLHHHENVLLLPNAWDAASARLLARAGAKAVATSSASMSWSLGYPDGSVLPPEQLVSAVHRICRLLPIPLTVDIEDGFSAAPDDVADLAAAVAAAGAAGINIEDGAGSVELLARKMAAIRARNGCASLFINARTDVFLRSLARGADATAMVVQRGLSYAEAGADGLFVPGLSSLTDVSRIAKAVPLPLNLMTVPGLAPLQELAQAGVRRLSAGPATFLSTYSHFCTSAAAFLQGDVNSFPGGELTYDEMNALTA